MNSLNLSSNVNSSEAQSTAQYINSFLDLVENLPNEISRHLSQLHQLNNNYLKLINRTDTNVDRYKQVMTALANSSNTNTNCKDIESEESVETLIDKRRNLSKKIETQLIQIQELSDEKLRYSQIIFDLIETKAKELDLDYEEVNQFNGKINTNSSEKTVNRINGNTSNKINANNSSQNGSNSSTTLQIKDDDKNKETNEEINNKIIDKRSLPRRACALKSSQTFETNHSNEDIIETNVAKVAQNKTIKSKSFSKCHNFGLSMSNFYRNMARRRAKLPKGSKICKIGAKISDTKKSVQTVKQNDRKSKTNRNSIKRLIAAKSGVKQTNGSNSDVHKKLVRNKSSNGYSSSTSSSSSSISEENDDFEVVANGSNSRNNNEKKDKNSNQENSRRESKRSANNHNNSNYNKKSKTNSNSIESTEQFVGEPIDPNEPTYCLCDQVSFGQMICCDNDRCSIEWFHFPCVGLDVKPKGKWYCPHCRKAPRLQNVPKRQTNSAKD